MVNNREKNNFFGRIICVGQKVDIPLHCSSEINRTQNTEVTSLLLSIIRRTMLK